MAAKTCQVILTASQCVVKIEVADTTPGSFPELVDLSEENGWFIEAFSQPRGHKAQYTFMPARRGEDKGATFLMGFVSVDEAYGLGQKLIFQSLTLTI